MLSRGTQVKGKALERWQALCAQAATEQDPKKLMQLVVEINQLLEEKEKRLQKPDSDGNVSRS